LQFEKLLHESMEEEMNSLLKSHTTGMNGVNLDKNKEFREYFVTMLKNVYDFIFEVSKCCSDFLEAAKKFTNADKARKNLCLGNFSNLAFFAGRFNWNPLEE
jgi:hypothetical protein